MGGQGAVVFGDMSRTPVAVKFFFVPEAFRRESQAASEQVRAPCMCVPPQHKSSPRSGKAVGTREQTLAA